MHCPAAQWSHAGIPLLLAIPALFLFRMAVGIVPDSPGFYQQDDYPDNSLLEEVNQIVTSTIVHAPTVMDFITTQVYNYRDNPKVKFVFDNINNQSVSNSLGRYKQEECTVILVNISQVDRYAIWVT
ncbi:hypothetical protein BJ742DRAFT_741811 [Cladochytrium replicatum]|nr:hypothetical protein BJ742DRAFT_741811 [Cladochytrium replicatum]